MKRKIALLLITTIAVNSSMILAGAANIQATSDVVEQGLPTADVFNVDFTVGMEDQSVIPSRLHKKIGSPFIREFSDLGRTVGSFNGKSASLYAFDENKYGKISKNLTIECMVKFNEISNGERDFFSNQENGGIGLGLENGILTFFAHVGGAYRQPTAKVSANRWYHIVGVVDGTNVKLYVDGKLQEVNSDASYEGVKYPEDSSVWNMVLGGDSDDDHSVQFFSDVDMGFAKIYSRAVTDEEVLQMSNSAFYDVDIEERGLVNLGMVGSDTTSEGSVWDLDIHANKNSNYDVNKIEYDIMYDVSCLEYSGTQYLTEDAFVTETEPGKLHVVLNRWLSTSSFKNYADTRIGRLQFRTKVLDESVTTSISTGNYSAYFNDGQIDQEISPDINKELQIFSKKELDLNRDGVIGVGDVVMADGEFKKSVAAESSIFPYKHAVILTVDGAGTVWNPDGIYYAPNNWTTPVIYSDEETMSKRKNDYVVDLMNHEFATSYTAQAVQPSMSAQNYFSILHGISWMEAPGDYQIDNDSTGVEYFTDFNRTPPLYPSIFKAVSDAFPERQNVAFAEWSNIINGIIEPDAQVTGRTSAEKQSFYDVAEFIRSEAYKNTAVVYMQSDWMDHVGHSSGYFNENYYNELQHYDNYYKAVIKALKETERYEDTLIVTNADHGGSGYNHGSTDPSNMDVFIGVGGQTVNSGTRLNNGSNGDISPIVLSALRVDIPNSMTGQVFDNNMFLRQEELYKKNRDIENIIFKCGENAGELSLKNPRSETRAVDAVIDLKGAEVETVETEGTIVRQEVVNGMLNLTISYNNQPVKIATIRFLSQGNEQPVLKELMLGTETGKEIYPDIKNEKGEPVEKPDISSLNLAITMTEKQKEEHEKNQFYTEESWGKAEEALIEAKELAKKVDLTQEEADESLVKLITACNLLEYKPQKVGLRAALSGAEAILADVEKLKQYAPECIDAVRNAVEKVKNVSENSAVDQGIINQATTDLLTAVTSMLVIKENTRLSILIQKAEQILEKAERYTPSSINKLKTALEKAKNANNQHVEAEMTVAYEKLAEALTSLVRKANKDELSNALNKAKEILKYASKYLENSIAQLEPVTKEAQEIYDNPDTDTSMTGEVLKILIQEILKARLMGDIDWNSVVNTKDAAILLSYNAEKIDFTEEQKTLSDINFDGRSDSCDAGLILKLTAEKISEFKK
ncbi:LamG-like jellyroll fold domain-containing protein [uncultured Robinsoniella sp.]|uniref:LamG-like jellyroll fold domain-containing protein n=1 Tax=uncultured Robinsoniella sp. TaxID=904190 RepID=UPI00374FCB29